jgi:hypothetical protein
LEHDARTLVYTLSAVEQALLLSFQLLASADARALLFILSAVARVILSTLKAVAGALLLIRLSCCVGAFDYIISCCARVPVLKVLRLVYSSYLQYTVSSYK